MTYTILIDDSGERFRCRAEQNLLQGMEALNRRGIPVGCRGGGCGVCKVRVLEGPYRTERMSSSCVSAEEQARGYALACRLFATGDLRVQVVGKMQRAVQRPSMNFSRSEVRAAPPGGSD